MRPVLLCLLVLAPAIAASARSPVAEMVPLGDRQFECRKGQLRLHGDSGSMYYPSGKHEKVTVPTKVGILSYTCNYVRSIVSCPVHTTVVTVKRGAYAGRYDVECLGEPVIVVPGVVDDVSPEDAPPDGAATDAGTATPP